MGPGPILSGMAVRTLKIKYEAYDDAVTRRRVQLCISKDRRDIYYEFDEENTANEESESKPQSKHVVPSPAPKVEAASPVISSSPQKSAGPVS